MGYDPFSLLAIAKVNVLCVPAHGITPPRFEAAINRLNESCRIITKSASSLANGKIEDVRVSGRHENAIFFSFGAERHATVSQHGRLFEPNRRPQVILGMIDGQHFSDLPEKNTGFGSVLAEIRTQFQTSVSYEYEANVVTEMLVFDYPGAQAFTDVIFVTLSSGDSEIQSSFRRIIHQFEAELSRLSNATSETPTIDRNGASHSSPVLNTSHAVDDSDTTSHSQTLQKVDERPTSQPVSNSHLHPSNIIGQSIAHLQSGEWERSFEQATEGARIARNQNLHNWHARALETLLCCMLLRLWRNDPFIVPQNLYTTSRTVSSSGAMSLIADANRLSFDAAGGKQSSAPMEILTSTLPGFVATIYDLYDRSATDLNDPKTSLQKHEAKLRLVNLLILVKINGCSLSESALSQMIDAKENNAPKTNSGSSLILRSSVLADVLMEVIEDAQIALPTHLAVPIYIAACRGLCNLELRRKHGFELRDVLQKLVPALLEARRLGAAEAGVHPSTGLTKNARSLREELVMQEALQSLLRMVCDVHDIRIISENELSSHSNGVETKLAVWLSSSLSGDVALKLEIIRLCIRVSDAFPDNKGSLFFMSLIFCVARQAVTVSMTNQNPTPLISTEEQSRILSGLKRIVESATNGMTSTLRGEYWDDFLLRDVQIAAQPSTGRLVPHLPQDLSITSSIGSDVKKDPFIYNPFSQAKISDGLSILVKGETALFDVVLQNPLEIEVEIEGIWLVGEGCGFEPNHHSVVLGPLCSQVFTLSGRPTDTGTLTITGCRASIRYCYERHFRIFRDSWIPPKDSKPKSSKLRASKTKSGYAQMPLNTKTPRAEQLCVTVIDPLPILSITSCSLPQNSAMLLEGETKSFTVTVSNISEMDVDFVHFTYEDSVTERLREAMMNRDLSPADLYEIQHQLAATPTVKRSPRLHQHDNNRAKKNIAAQSSEVFDFDLLGKAGLTFATILIDYGFLGKPKKEIDSTFYTRQIKLAIGITVNGTINMPRCNIVPIHDYTANPCESETKQHQPKESPLSSKHGDGQAQNQACAVQLDVRNIWPQPLVVDIEGDFTASSSEGFRKWTSLYSHTLQPGQVERALFLVPRLFVANPLSQIPSLDKKRQFVVSTSKTSLELEAASRETFWYREELLKRLRMRWKDEYGQRQGNIDTRKGIRLSMRMIEALKVDHIDISFDIKPVQSHDNDLLSRIGDNHFRIQKDTLTTMVVKIRNKTKDSLRLFLRLQPCLREQSHTVALDLSKRLGWSGVLQRALPGSLDSDQSCTYELGLVALAAGGYEVGASVEELRSHFPRSEPSAIGLSAMERRIWHARKVCLIDAVDNNNDT